MEANVVSMENKSVVKLTGRLDFKGHRAFNEACTPLLQQPGVRTVDINLAGIDYIDSSGLGLLMLLNEKAQAAGKDVVLSHPQHTVLQILNIANMGQLFDIVEK